MLVDQLEIHRTLWRLVQTLTTDRAAQEDLVQEALIHLWQRESGRAGQSRSWYIESCRLHLLNCLHRGRSLDSVKRCHARRLTDSFDCEDTAADSRECDDSLLPAVCAHDVLNLLFSRISTSEQKILHCLADGFHVREIARKLNVSHQAVSKHRQHIAALATELGISPLSRSSSPPAALLLEPGQRVNL